jgi:hypothetical protein
MGVEKVFPRVTPVGAAVSVQLGSSRSQQPWTPVLKTLIWPMSDGVIATVIAKAIKYFRLFNILLLFLFLPGPGHGACYP